MIYFQNITYSYDKDSPSSLANVTLRVDDGEVVLLTGLSGSGKSTLLRLANGLIPHYHEGDLSGTVTVAGLEPQEKELYELAEIVGSVFQNPQTQFFCLNTTEELAFSCENFGLPTDEIESRLEATAKGLHLDTLLDRNPFTLSGGQKQRIACGSAQMMNQEILVLDEPSSNLDGRSVNLLAEVIAHWKAAGKTVLVAEHRLGYLKGIVDRVIVLERGAIKNNFAAQDFYGLASRDFIEMGLRDPNTECCVRPPSQPGIVDRGDVSIADLHYSYPKSDHGLNIPTARFPVGGITAMVGENGAGKSTFLRCLCGLNRRCRGTLKIADEVFNLNKPSKQAYMVMQDTGNQLFAESVRAEVEAACKSPEITTSVLNALDLSDLAPRHPLSLSGGQQQRVAIASAIASGRDLLLLDEPTSGLDYLSMREVASALEKSAKMGCAVIVVTHDREFITNCCTHYAVLSGGNLSETKVLDESSVDKLNAALDVIQTGSDDSLDAT